MAEHAANFMMDDIFNEELFDLRAGIVVALILEVKEVKFFSFRCE